jgi:hypothetical protein
LGEGRRKEDTPQSVTRVRCGVLGQRYITLYLSTQTDNFFLSQGELSNTLFFLSLQLTHTNTYSVSLDPHTALLTTVVGFLYDTNRKSKGRQGMDGALSQPLHLSLSLSPSLSLTSLPQARAMSSAAAIIGEEDLPENGPLLRLRLVRYIWGEREVEKRVCCFLLTSSCLNVLPSQHKESARGYAKRGLGVAHPYVVVKVCRVESAL